MSFLAFLGKKSSPDVVDIASPEHKASAIAFYARLRAESPVHRISLPDKQTAYLVTRYDDVAAVLRDERFVKNPRNALTPGQLEKQPWMPPIFRPLLKNMLDQDPPAQTRLRALVQKAFTPRLVELLRPRIEELANELCDGLAGRKRIDLIRDYALPIPTTIIAELLGVPVRDRHKFQHWSQSIVSVTPGSIAMVFAIPHVWFFLRYIRQLIRVKRTAPRDDLLSALVHAEEAGQSLDEDELVAMAFLLLIAGHETTVNLIGNGMLALFEHPDQLALLRADPELIKPAIEELLRYASPLETATERYAREDVTIAGVTIPRGALVFAALASANRDERRFPNPDRLDITRDPNKHLSFGLGAHFCVGAPLARLEGQIAIGTMLRRLPTLRLAVPSSKLTWRRGMVLRGLRRLPLRVG